jgi:hypothetical protein
VGGGRQRVFRGPLQIAAACEGLNLQRLGAQVNVDLRTLHGSNSGRAGCRIGQVRDDIHILNLRYAGTVEVPYTFPEFVAEKMRRSHEYAGRSVFGWEPAPTGDSDWPDGKNSTALTPLSPAATDNRPAKVFVYRFCCVKLCLRPFVRSGKSVAHA